MRTTRFLRVFAAVILALFVPWFSIPAQAQENPADGDSDSVNAIDTASSILGGHDAPPGRYPYTVSLQFVSKLYPSCGASMIAPDIAITAAHCTKGPKEGYAARVGGWDLRDPLPGSEIFAIKELLRHPKFDRTYLTNDITVMVLDMNVTERTTERPYIRLNTDPGVPVHRDELTVVGWGDTTDQDRVYPYRLQEFNSAVYVPRQNCVRPSSISDDMMCTLEGFDEGTCVGDSGGPLIRRGDRWEDDVQLGLVSWVMGTGVILSCSAAHLPSVYARVSHLYPWIREHVCNHSQAPPEYMNCPPPSDGDNDEDEEVPASPAATLPPTPVPPEAYTTITVTLSVARRADRVGWRIEDMDGNVLHNFPVFSYIHANRVELERITVPMNRILNIVVVDISGWSLIRPTDNEPAVHVFLGDEVDTSKVLAVVEPLLSDGERYTSFETTLDAVFPSGPVTTTQPRATPQPSVSLMPVPGDVIVTGTLKIVFDTYPITTWWQLFLDGSNRVLAQGGPYSPFVDPIIYVTLPLRENFNHRFRIWSDRSLGMCCDYGQGSVTLTLDSTGEQLFFEDGRFGRFRDHRFFVAPRVGERPETTSPSWTPSSEPSPKIPSMTPSVSLMPSIPPPTPSPTDPTAVSVTVRLVAQSYRRITARIEMADTRTLVHEIIPGRSSGAVLDTITLTRDHRYLFTITDPEGQGSGYRGRVFVYLGSSIDVGNTIMYFNGEFGYVRKQYFLTSPVGLVGFTSFPSSMPTSSPSGYPSSSALPTNVPSRSVAPSRSPSGHPTNFPTISARPSVSSSPSVATMADVLIVLKTDRAPEEIGWEVRKFDGTFPSVKAPGSFDVVEGTISELLRLEVGGMYTISFEDSGGNGYCCENGRGRAVVYLGNHVDNSRVLVFEDGNFSRFSTHFLVIDPSYFLEPPPSPPTLPPPSGSPSEEPTDMPTAWVPQPLPGAGDNSKQMSTGTRGSILGQGRAEASSVP